MLWGLRDDFQDDEYVEEKTVAVMGPNVDQGHRMDKHTELRLTAEEHAKLIDNALSSTAHPRHVRKNPIVDRSCQREIS